MRNGLCALCVRFFARRVEGGELVSEGVRIRVALATLAGLVEVADGARDVLGVGDGVLDVVGELVDVVLLERLHPKGDLLEEAAADDGERVLVLEEGGELALVRLVFGEEVPQLQLEHLPAGGRRGLVCLLLRADLGGEGGVAVEDRLALLLVRGERGVDGSEHLLGVLLVADAADEVAGEPAGPGRELANGGEDAAHAGGGQFRLGVLHEGFVGGGVFGGHGRSVVRSFGRSVGCGIRGGRLRVRLVERRRLRSAMCGAALVPRRGM